MNDRSVTLSWTNQLKAWIGMHTKITRNIRTPNIIPLASKIHKNRVNVRLSGNADCEWCLWACGYVKVTCSWRVCVSWKTFVFFGKFLEGLFVEWKWKRRCVFVGFLFQRAVNYLFCSDCKELGGEKSYVQVKVCNFWCDFSVLDI